MRLRTLVSLLPAHYPSLVLLPRTKATRYRAIANPRIASRLSHLHALATALDD